jgi:hypothetical protein
MILTPQMFDVFDRCERRLAYERTHEPTTISAVGLLYAAIEAGMVSMDPKQGAKDALIALTSRLDVHAGDLSPISAVRHIECMAEVIGLALRAKMGQCSRPDRVALGQHEWQSNLFLARGELHRIILTSHMDDDSLRSFAHAWQTVGELAALERLITLTVVIIGAQRGGRRHSHWAKASQHPIQKSALRFAPRKKDEEFTSNWKTVWREQTDISAETWLDRMKSDEVLPDLILSRRIQYNGEDQRMIQAKQDMLAIAEKMETASVYAPMRRSSCDELGKGACPWQNVCYSSTPVTPDDLSWLYREKHLVTLRSGM